MHQGEPDLGITYTRYGQPNGQPRMNHPEKLATSCIQHNEDKQIRKQHKKAKRRATRTQQKPDVKPRARISKQFL